MSQRLPELKHHLFTDTKNIASGTQYYYTVRAYMLQGRLKVYGAYDTNGILAQ